MLATGSQLRFYRSSLNGDSFELGSWLQMRYNQNVRLHQRKQNALEVK